MGHKRKDKNVNDQQIIKEQRDQLLQLRAELNILKAGGITLPQLRELTATFEAKSVGKTVGLKINDERRSRLMFQQGRIGAKSHRQVVETCIELGLRHLEGVKDGKGIVEAVQGVQRPSDSGNEPVRAAVGM